MKLRIMIATVLTSASALFTVNNADAQVRARITIGQPQTRIYTAPPRVYQRPYVRPYYGYRHDNGRHNGWYKNNRGWERKDLYDSRDRYYDDHNRRGNMLNDHHDNHNGNFRRGR